MSRRLFTVSSARRWLLRGFPYATNRRRSMATQRLPCNRVLDLSQQKGVKRRAHSLRPRSGVALGNGISR